MPLSHRTERIAEQVREELSQMLATEVSDPGVGLVTVTRVKVTADLSLARIYWTIIGDAAERKKTEKALKRTIPYLRHLLASRLTLRRVPELAFQFDESVAAQDRIERILQEIHNADHERRSEEAQDAESADKARAADDTEQRGHVRAADDADRADRARAAHGADDADKADKVDGAGSKRGDRDQ